LDVHNHPLLIDVAELQACQLGVSGSGGVKRHQQGAMEGSAGGLDQSSDFFLAEDRWKAMALFRIGSLGNAPTPLECLSVKEPQGCQTDRDAAR
jgi:hypothetical protein